VNTLDCFKKGFFEEVTFQLTLDRADSLAEIRGRSTPAKGKETFLRPEQIG
jgi:hypothetical protein